MGLLVSWIVLIQGIFVINQVGFCVVMIVLSYIAFEDDGGRYAYDKQPSICKWNLRKLSEALSLCLPEEKAREGLEL